MKDISEITKGLLDKISGWYETAVLMLPNIVIAIVVVVFFALVAKLIRKGVDKLLSRTTGNQAIIDLISTIAYVGVIIIGTFVALGVLDLEKTVTSLLAGVGVIGLALGFAFQNTASNFISGVLMASDFPLNVGDLVETNGHFAVVDRISLRYTTLKSLKGQTVVVPNKMILEESLINYTIDNERRVDVNCGVGYGSDLEQVEQVALEAVGALEERDKDKAVELMYSEFGDSSIDFTMRFWIKEYSNKAFLNMQSKAVKAIKKAFDAEGINIPFPIRTLEFRPAQLEQLLGAKESEEGQRSEKEEVEQKADRSE